MKPADTNLCTFPSLDVFSPACVGMGSSFKGDWLVCCSG